MANSLAYFLHLNGKKMFVRWKLAGSAALVFLCFSCSDTSLQSYEHKEYTVNYPASWERNENSGITYFVPSEKEAGAIFTDYVNINLQDLPTLPTDTLGLDFFTEHTKKSIEQMQGNMKLLALSDTVISGTKAKRLSYLQKLKSSDLQGLQYFLVHKNKAFVLTYLANETSYSKHLNAFGKMVQSFSLR